MNTRPRRRTLRYWRTRTSVFWVAGALALGQSGWAQAPIPLMAPTSSAKLLSTESAVVGAPVPVGEVDQMEKYVAQLARADALRVAATYAQLDAKTLPGMQKLGAQLTEELAKPGQGFDFPGLVSRNPAFWLAERELAPTDVSLPYLVAMLAMLNRNYVTAARTIALAQATLPLTPTVRRSYARPEAMLLYLDGLLLTGIPSASRMETVAQCDTSIQRLRARIAQWSNRPGLLRALIELEVRRAEMLTEKGQHQELLDQRLGDRLQLTPEDLNFVRYDDPILAQGLESTVRQWVNKRTLAQKWSRWIEFGDAAEADDVAASVAAFAASGRADLAWLAWRAEMVLRGGIAGRQKQESWKPWCEQLLDASSAAFIEKATAADPQKGTVAWPIEDEEAGPAWSGDQNIHPLLAIKIERQIAMVDTMLAVTPAGSYKEGSLRLQRGQLLCEIDAVEPSRRDLRRVLQIINNSERIIAAPGVKVMEFVKVVEARLLDTEQHYAAAEKLYAELLPNPRLNGVRRNYAVHLVMAGNLAAAHAEYRALALGQEADTYRAIMADLTARRLGGREANILRQAERKVAPDAWVAAGVKYFLGEFSEEDLLRRARQGTVLEIADHESEGYFWLAERALAEGRTDDGIKWLNHCIGTGYLSNSEFKMAKAELERLAPKEKTKKSEPENSPGGITT